MPCSVLAIVFSRQLGDLLTGNLPRGRLRVAARALSWVVPAAFAQMLAALARARSRPATATSSRPSATRSGAVAGLVDLRRARGRRTGSSRSRGALAVNGALAVGIPLARARAPRASPRQPRAAAIAIGPRLRKLVQAAAVPLALQGLYVIALRGASGLGEGNQTSLTYAYLFASTLVAATASSLSLISSAPLTRRGLDAESASAHVAARVVAEPRR